MSYLEKFQFDKPKLLIFYLGGEIEGFDLEVHDIFFTVGKSYEEVIPKIKKKWAGTPESVHVDSWLPLEVVNGHEVSLSKEKSIDSKNKLFFINLGYYLDGSFGEFHRMHFLVADSKEKAKKLAREKVDKEKILHVDDLYDIDNVLELNEIDGYQISLNQTSSNQATIPTNGYFKLSEKSL